MSKTFDDKNANDRAAAPGFDDPAMEREWQLQERAQREERAGAPMAADDPRLAQYRLLTRALRAPVMEPIPFGFAEQVARRAQAVAITNDRVERYLQQLLLGALVVAGVWFAWSSSAGWLRRDLGLGRHRARDRPGPRRRRTRGLRSVVRRLHGVD